MILAHETCTPLTYYLELPLTELAAWADALSKLQAEQDGGDSN